MGDVIEAGITAREKRGSHDSDRRAGVIVPLTVALGFYTVFVVRSMFRLDGRPAFSLFEDAMISMTYARNLSEGNGLVWSVGDPPVEGITNPLWTGVMALLHLLPLDDPTTPLAVSIVGGGILVATALAARAIARRLLPEAEYAPTIAVWLVGLYYPLVFWTLRGMEVGLVGLLVACGILLCLRLRDGDRPQRDAWLLAGVAAAGMLTRPDFAVFVAVWGWFLGYRLAGGVGRRGLILLLAGSIGALVAQEGARLAYYGEWLPNTYTLKVTGFPLGTRLARGLTGLAYGVTSEYGALCVLSAPAMGRRSRDGSLLAASFAAAAGYSVYVGGDAWEWIRYPNRYVTPGLVPLLVLAALGIERLLDVRRGGRARRWWWGSAAAVGGLAALAWWNPWPVHLLQQTRHFATGILAPPEAVLFVLAAALYAVPVLDETPRVHIRTGPAAALVTAALFGATSLPPLLHWTREAGIEVRDDAALANLGLLVRTATEPEARVAVTAGGGPLYFAHRRGLDLLGKSDRRVARLPPQDQDFYPGHSKWDYRLTIVGDRPDLVAQLWRPSRDDLAAILQAGYVPVDVVDDRYSHEHWDDGSVLARRDSDALRWDRLRVLPEAMFVERYTPDG